MKNLKLIFLSFVFISTQAFATELGNQSYLNKISHALRGVPPTEREYFELQQAENENRVEEFLNQKRGQYIKSPLYVDKMRWRVIELFKLAPAKSVTLLNPEVPSYDTSRYNSTDALLITLFSENRPWDFLLTGQEYRLYNTTSNPFGSLSAGTLYKQLISPEQLQSVKNLKVSESMLVKFPETDGRLAGILTSERFFDRYATTAVNKNRRRAAAIFRTFLCDNMLAAVPDPGENKSKIIDIQYPHQADQNFSESEVQAASVMQDGLHGTQADCMACHYKLDPMGKTFLGSPIVLSGHEWPGALSFKNSKKEIVNIPVKNIHELGQAITAQDDYLSCQIKHFWEWFIGKDINLTPEIESQLAKQFNSVGRRPNDFVNLLLQRPEFKTRRIETPEQTVSRRTMEIFKKCQSCHAGKTDDSTGDPLVDLTVWPLGQNTSETDPQYWINKIKKKLDLDHGGRNRVMPPKTSGWSLTRDEMLTIQQWIDIGTPDKILKVVKP